MTERNPGRGDPTAATATSAPADVSPAAKRWSLAVASVLLLWFLFAWLILDRHFLDAAGESVGTALALGVVVSLVGALRSSR